MVDVSLTDAIATVAIDRAPVNALPPDAWHELASSFAKLSEDTNIRAAVLTGGDGRFCAGADIAVLAEPSEPDAYMLRIVGDAAAAIRSCRVPVIGAIDGPAHGGGLELALACDIRLGSPAATFSASGVNMGLIASVPTLTAAVGPNRSAHMLLTGERIDSQTALNWGLLTSLVDGPAIAADELAATIAAKPPLAVEANKVALQHAGSTRPSDHGELVKMLYKRLEATADHAEAVAAFLEKRSPTFTRD